MGKSTASPAIRLRGVRHNNLKNFDLDLPLRKLIVITGLSGSGKSTLAFDTLFAEGQRRYIETFSPYARQFFDRMDKPQVDSIEGIPPAIAVEQRNTVRTTRSTVGTMTEICDYLKVLWPRVAQLHCRQCGEPVRREPPQVVWENVISDAGCRTPDDKGKAESRKRKAEASEVLITFDLPLSEKLSLAESLELISRQGYQRLLLDGKIIRVDEAGRHSALRNPSGRSEAKTNPHSALTVVQDRLRLTPSHRARFIEACEQAYHFGKGKLTVFELSPEPPASSIQHPASSIQHPAPGIRNPRSFSDRLHCAACDIEYREPTTALFSFNHPLGACPKCKGFGRVISIDYDLAIPDWSKTLAEGAVKPWQSGVSAECQQDLKRFCRAMDIPMDVPFSRLPRRTQDWVIQGDPEYGVDEEHEWPRAWYGVKGYFRWLESKSYKMHVRVLLSRYRAYTTCPDCQGQRFQPDALLYQLRINARHPASSIEHRASSLTLADFYALPIRDALRVVDELSAGLKTKHSDALSLALQEVRSRLSYLVEVGLGYLTLDRPTRTLSGGETERVNLTTCLGTGLVNTLFVLDEPSVGLHPRDTDRLVNILQRLRDAGNTVVVVEHEASVIRAADQVVDMGPGHGVTGGEIVFQGSLRQLVKHRLSLTGQYLSGRKQVELPPRRPVDLPSTLVQNGRAKDANTAPALTLQEAPAGTLSGCQSPPVLRLCHATKHNLQDVSVQIPLERLVCVTGVSGSGKTTLIREVLLPALNARLGADGVTAKASDRLDSDGGSDDSDDSALRNRPGRSEAKTDPQSALVEGWEQLDRVALVDQSLLGKTPRSNPAVYIGAFDDIRELFAATELASQRGLSASAFSFNSAQGQCDRCRGAGFEKIEMQFLSDVFIRCPECNGRRYREHILEVKIRNPNSKFRNEWSIADVLEATVEEVVDFLRTHKDSRAAERAVGRLELLRDVGLGYLQLGQPINTLSGGESQRLKLVSHLVETLFLARPRARTEGRTASQHPASSQRTLFLFDEPTTGLHFDDVRVLLNVFQRLVDAGHSVVIIEHNLDVIKSADWVIDLGPDAGDEGGRLVACGTPEEVAGCGRSHTGQALRGVLSNPEGQPVNYRPSSRRK